MAMFRINKDREIIDAIKTGQNTFVLNHLYKYALPPILKYITQNNGDDDEAKDIFQDAVIILFTNVKLGKFDESKDITAFLYFISRNLWINRVKRRNRQFDIGKVQLSEVDEGPLAIVITDEKKKAIEELMDKAGSRCKELMRYALYDDFSMKEIAIKMGFSAESVAKTTHYRCKQKLIELVENNKNLLDLFKR